MKTLHNTYGTGKWQRQTWEYVPENGIEATLLKLLDSLESLNNGLAIIEEEGGDIERCWGYTLSIRETQQVLSACLA